MAVVNSETPIKVKTHLNYLSLIPQFPNDKQKYVEIKELIVENFNYL